MSTVANILGAVGTTLAGVAGLSAAKVVRGSPLALLGRPSVTAPACYLWVDSLQVTRGPQSRTYTVRLTVGWYLAATATGSTVAAFEAGAVELLSLVSGALLADPSCGGHAHDIERLDMTANGTVPGPTEADAPGCWLAGVLVVRYQTTGAI